MKLHKLCVDYYTDVRVGGFFSGIGSHISACERLRDRADFKYVFQCETDERAVLANNLLHGEIQNLGDITKIRDIGGPLAVDILYWTPPCQDISIIGQKAGNSKESGTRSALAYEVPRILAATPERERPTYLVMEEVPMMVSKKFKANFDTLLDELSAIGYQHTWGILNATDCGVPQSRRRLFVISRLGHPAPDMPAPLPLSKCMRDYLEPIVSEEYYLSEDRLKGLEWSNQKEVIAGRGFRFQPTDGSGIAHSITTHAGGRKTDNFIIRAATLKTYSWDHMNRVYCPLGASPTIRTYMGGSLEPKIQRNEEKENPGISKLTEKECLRLQGFTEEEADILRYAEKDGRRMFPKTVLYRFAGNAVCVNCFERITAQILNMGDL